MNAEPVMFKTQGSGDHWGTLALPMSPSSAVLSTCLGEGRERGEVRAARCREGVRHLRLTSKELVSHASAGALIAAAR